MKDFYPFKQHVFDSWIKSNGDHTLRLDYDLTQNSLVIDAGGYKGEWSKSIFNLYGCSIIIFEPVTRYFDIIEQKFIGNEKISVIKRGLSNEDKEILIFDSEDSSSVFWGDRESEKIQLAKFSSFVSTQRIKEIDLIKINIEGGEYDLLEDIIGSGLVNRISNLQIQFHRFIEGCQEKRDLIRKELSKTHSLTYDYEFIWENWKLDSTKKKEIHNE
jgi:FkbM family methyltransferase